MTKDEKKLSHEEEILGVEIDALQHRLNNKTSLFFRQVLTLLVLCTVVFAVFLRLGMLFGGWLRTISH